MRRLPTLALTLLIPGPVAAGPEVVPVPPPKAGEWSEVRAVPGRLLVLSAQPASKWLLVDDEGCDLRDFDAGKSAAFCAPAAGRFKLIVTGPDGSASKVVVVVVGDAPPGPKPNPPDPPKPPADPLKEKVAAAFGEDPETDGPKKKSQAKDLAELYRQLAAKVVPDANLTGPTQLFERARDTAKLLVGDKALLGVRRVVGEELAAILPVEAPLTAAQRDAAAKLFGRLAAILDSLGG